MLTVPIKPGQLVQLRPQQGGRIGVIVRGPYTDGGGLGDFCDIWFGNVHYIPTSPTDPYEVRKPFVEKLIIRDDWKLVDTPMGV